MPTAPTVPTALYLDFDNVFGGLLKLDPRLALRFAEQPSLWVDRLTSQMHSAGDRRWLVLRCYLNPSGSVPHPDDSSTRLYFSRFRLPFTDAGFEVIDCPRLTHTKNGADIKLVLDAAEALRADVRYEEFVIASGDSDITPLLVRLRAADRRITVLSPSDSAEVLGAIAHRLVGGSDLLELLEAHVVPVEPPIVADDTSEDAPPPPAPEHVEEMLDVETARAGFAALVRELYDDATEPISLTKLAQQVRAELGPVVTASRWFGHDGFGRAVRALDLPGARMSQHEMWDSTRHTTPEGWEPSTPRAGMPEPVARVTAELRLPPLDQVMWSVICLKLTAYVTAYDYNLTEITRWTRDRLVETGVEVNRRAVTVVVQGASYGGCPLYRDPVPTPPEIQQAFATNVINRARAADLTLSDDDVATLQSWFGG